MRLLNNELLVFGQPWEGYFMPHPVNISRDV